MTATSGASGLGRVLSETLGLPLPGAAPPRPDSRADPLDGRLAIAASGGWLALLAVHRWGAPGGLWCSAAAMVVGVLVLARTAGRNHVGRVIGLAGLTAAAVIVVAFPASLRANRTAGSLATLVARRADVTIVAELTSDPRPLGVRGVAGQPRSVVDATLMTVAVDGMSRTVRQRIVLFTSGSGFPSLLPGQRVRVDGRLGPADDPFTAATVSVQGVPELVGRPPWWQRGAGSVRSGLQRACRGLPSLSGGLLPGLVDGDTSRLDPVLAERFRTAGLTHLVAVSGTNCSIVVGTAILALTRLKRSPRAIATGALVVLVAFVVIARPTASVLRAAAMSVIALAGLATGRQRSVLPMLAAAVLALLVWHPWLAVDLGFLLSVLATVSLILLAPAWCAGLRSLGLPAVLAEGVAVAAAAHLMTAPVIVGLSGRVSLVAIPANLLAEPVVAVATILGFAAALTSVLSSPVASGLAQLAGWPCRWLVLVADRFGALPGAGLPWPSGVIGSALLVLAVAVVALLCRRRGTRVLVLTALLVVVLVQLPVRWAVAGWPPAGWLMVACDVGQGDGLVLNAGAGSGVVVDTGPDPVVMDRCLHEWGFIAFGCWS